VQAKLPGVQFIETPGIGDGAFGLTMYLGASASLTFPTGSCGLAGAQNTKH